MGIVLPGVLGRFPLGTRQGTSLRGASIHLSGLMFLGRSLAWMWLEEDSGRQERGMFRHSLAEGPVDLTCEAGPPGWGAWTHP